MKGHGGAKGVVELQDDFAQRSRVGGGIVENVENRSKANPSLDPRFGRGLIGVLVVHAFIVRAER